MMKRLALGLMTPIWLASSAQAIETKYSEDQLPLLNQEAQHKAASTRVAGLFTRTHFKLFDFNDEFSSKVFDRYVKQLDYNRNLFLAEDIKQFDKHRYDFDEMIKSGKLAAAYEIYQLHLTRRYQRYAYALTLLDTPMEFNKPDNYLFDREEAPWAVTTNELDELWRQRVKYDALNLKVTGKEWPEIAKILGKRYNNALKRITQSQSEDVFQTVMNSFARAIDPHTSYLSPRNAERFKMEMSLSLEGIGALLQVEDDYTVIKSLVPGGPAEQSELLSPDDKIIGVGQEEGPIVDIIGWRLDDVVDLIKGKKDSTVNLEILPGKAGAGAKPKVVSIVRKKIHLEDRAVKSEVYVPKNEQYKDHKLGVIKIPSFYVNLTEDVKKEITSLTEKGVEGIVVDLRNNGGGALTEATALSGLFIDRGPVVQIKDGNSRIEVKKDMDGQVFYDGPVTVLVNRYSASASEIFAAAMQDYGRAIVLGEQTFGKGTVQQHRSLGRVFDFYDQPVGFVQYTISKFYRIDGGSTQNKGVVPDIPFPSAVEAEEFGESVADNALPWDQIPHAKYKEVIGYDKGFLGLLKQRYEQRIAVEPEFRYLSEDISYYKQEQDRKSFPLTEAALLARRDKLDKDRLKRANERLVREGEEAVASLDDLPNKMPNRDPYLAEATHITLDMIEQSRLVKN